MDFILLLRKSPRDHTYTSEAPSPTAGSAMASHFPPLPSKISCSYLSHFARFCWMRRWSLILFSYILTRFSASRNPPIIIADA